MKIQSNGKEYNAKYQKAESDLFSTSWLNLSTAIIQKSDGSVISPQLYDKAMTLEYNDGN
jgi:hypothetical protein